MLKLSEHRQPVQNRQPKGKAPLPRTFHPTAARHSSNSVRDQSLAYRPVLTAQPSAAAAAGVAAAYFRTP